MSVVFISGEFGSGTTLLFTLFRKTSDFHCLYEPLRQRLPYDLFWPTPVYEHHFFVDDYLTEYKGFRDLIKLFRTEWATSRLHLEPEDAADDLHRYLSYLIGMSFVRAPNVALKDNLLTFRLGWLRARFPDARILHVYRDPERQWNSLVRRSQRYVGREDIGQEKPDYGGFSLAAMCEDLAPSYPELEVNNFHSGYERFLKLMELSRKQHERHAHVSVDYDELRSDFDAACERMSAGLGVRLDAAQLRPYVVENPEVAKPLGATFHGSRARLARLVDRGGRRYAEMRVRWAARDGG